jgi:C-terminal processing protease CtpA/Prc
MAAALLSACRSAPPARPVNHLYSASELTADVTRMERAIREGHAALLKYRSGAEVDSIFRALLADASKAMTADDLWRRASRAVAGLRDNHTTVLPNAAVFEAVYRQPGQILPIRFAVIDSAVYVVRNYAGAAGPAEGSEVTAIDGRPVAEFLADCASYVSTDGDVRLRAVRKIERDFDLTCGLALGLAGTVELRTRSDSGGVGRFKIGTMSWRERRTKAVARDPRDTLSPPRAELSFRGDSSVAILTIRSFSKDDSFNVERFIDDSFRRITMARTRALVIDLRGNTGGRDTFAARLFTKFAADTFTYYADRALNKRRFQFIRSTDDWMLNYVAWFVPMQKRADGRYHLRMAMDKPMRPAAQAFRGPVVLLIDGSTISTPSELGSLFKAKGRGLIVGEESGSAFGGGTGAAVSVVLPNTGLILNVPIMSATMVPGVARGDDVRRGVIPDVIVRPTIADILAGRDVMLDTAVARAAAALR